MKKYIIIFFILVFSLFILNTDSAEAQSYLRDCSSVSGYSLITGGSCTAVVNTMSVFNFKAKDPDGGNLSWSMDWGDNKNALSRICPASFPNTTLSVGHAWTTPGTYNVRLSVSNCKAGGDASASFKVVVRSREDIGKLIPTNPVITPAPTVTLTPSSSSLPYGGGSSTIFVATTNATSCTVPWDRSIRRYFDPIAGKFFASTAGTASVSAITWINKDDVTKSAARDAFMEVFPTATTTYSISCTGLGGNAINRTTITVFPYKKPTATISINPTTVPLGGSTTITWSSTDATSCTAGGGPWDPWTGAKTTSGSETIKNLYDISGGSFSITCTGPGGNSEIAWVNYTTVILPTSDAFGLSGKFVSPTSILLTWNSTLPVGYKGGYKIYKNGTTFSNTRTDFVNGLPVNDNPTMIYDNDVRCPSTQRYQVEQFSYDDNWNVVPSGVLSGIATVTSSSCTF